MSACALACSAEGTLVARRGALLAFSAMVTTAAPPRGAEASYAMYAASQASFDVRAASAILHTAAHSAAWQQLQRDRLADLVAASIAGAQGDRIRACRHERPREPC